MAESKTMVVKHLYYLIAVFVFMLMAFPSMALADTPLPLVDFAQVTGNGQYIFVMLIPGTPEELSHLTYGPKADIRQRYSKSGLYRNDGTSIPLWTIDWVANERDVAVSPDGHHIARFGPWPMNNNDQELAVAFYNDRKEIRRYTVDQLVLLPILLPRSISHYGWLADHSFDSSHNRLDVTTEQGEAYTFNMADGNPVVPIFTSRLANRYLVFAVGIVIITTLVFARTRSRLRKS